MSTPPPRDPATLAAALAQHRARHRLEAESAYRELLKAEPANADAARERDYLFYVNHRAERLERNRRDPGRPLYDARKYAKRKSQACN